MTSTGRVRTGWARAFMAGLVGMAVLPGHAWAGPLLCAWDILGKGGEVHALAQDYAAAMAREGVHFEVRTFTDERVVAEDLRAGQCAAAILTGFRARPFNQVTGSLDSLGSAVVVRDGKVDLPASYEVLRKLIQVFASPQAASLMIEGQYEVGGIMPVGAAYPMLRERFEITPHTLAGKRVAAFDHDRVQGMLIQKMGAQAISSDVTNVGTKFNNGLVDLIHMPAITFKPFELAKGMGTKGRGAAHAGHDPDAAARLQPLAGAGFPGGAFARVLGGAARRGDEGHPARRGRGARPLLVRPAARPRAALCGRAARRAPGRCEGRALQLAHAQPDEEGALPALASDGRVQHADRVAVTR